MIRDACSSEMGLVKKASLAPPWRGKSSGGRRDIEFAVLCTYQGIAPYRFKSFVDKTRGPSFKPLLPQIRGSC